jgi:hypothetical protein
VHRLIFPDSAFAGVMVLGLIRGAKSKNVLSQWGKSQVRGDDK